MFWRSSTERSCGDAGDTLRLDKLFGRSSPLWAKQSPPLSEICIVIFHSINPLFSRSLGFGEKSGVSQVFVTMFKYVGRPCYLLSLPSFPENFFPLSIL